MAPVMRAALSLHLVVACAAACAPEPEPLPSMRVMTFNTGTSPGVVGDGGSENGDNGGYGPEQAAFSDEHYGDGLAWQAAVDDVQAFFAGADVDIVAFQELFASAGCVDVPEEARAGFVCETWQPGDPSVAEVVLGDDYAIACNVGKPDKCIGVKRSFGAIRGCESGMCLDALAGAAVAGCGGGSRVGRATIDLAGGAVLTVSAMHGTSGMAAGDMACRVEQVRQIFVDVGDGSGAPAVGSTNNIVLGDLNTDPGRLGGADPSADEINAHVSFRTGFDFVSPVGRDAPPTYAGFFNIDHVISDVVEGDCVSVGLTPGTAPVAGVDYFDHHPMLCDVVPRPAAD